MATDRAGELGIPEKMQLLHRALRAAGIAHAFGGALALAWCIREVRATMDIDVNVFVAVARRDDVLAAMPDGVRWDDVAVAALDRDGQARLFWGRHPVDVFLNTTAFHEQAARRVRFEPLLDDELPFLACADLAVFKAFFSRGKDWVDLGNMLDEGSFEVADVAGVLATHLGPDDERIDRLLRLARGPRRGREP